MPNLADVAHNMIEQTAEGGTASTRLSRGLYLTLAVEDGQKKLYLYRDNTRPSDQEVAIIRAVFKIPAEAEQLAGKRTVAIRWPA